MGKELQALADELHSAAIRLLRTVREVDQVSGLSAARLSALSVLVFAGPVTLGRLAAAEGVKSPTMTGIVNGLVREGMAERRTTAGDSRKVEVVVTPKGRRLFEQARRRRVGAVAELLKALEPVELDQVERSVAIIQRALAAGRSRR